MRTNIVIDDDLMERARQLTGLATKRAVVEEALRTLVQLRLQEKVRDLRGQLSWEGDLNSLRESRIADSGRLFGSTTSTASSQSKQATWISFLEKPESSLAT
ncbi:MAG: type II toxin-antitoxin system VapB family antitoxin [Acidobacteriota bacterium]